jgi:hypothetical protein
MELVYLCGFALLFCLYVLRRVMRFLEWSPLAAIRIKRSFNAAWREFCANRRNGEHRRCNVVPVAFERRTRPDRRTFAAAA